MSKSSVDRNLLFGLLALQNGIITRDALVAAFSIWQLNKSRKLDTILLEQRAISSERHAQLQQMLEWHIEVHGQDTAQSLAAVNSASSACQLLHDLGDIELQASLRQVLNSESVPDPFSTQIELKRPGTGTGLRFRSLRPHAKGGLGEVSVALDQELNREVALKEIQPQFANHQESRERFVLEAEITGGLEHPGIVPVYGLGTYPDGRPFYAMRFIKGDSMKDALEHFHQPATKSQTPPGERRIQLRKLLGRFIDVCNAMEYAHSRGVLHRDLKPGNIMLGKYGETLVVDWGLAKSMGKREIQSTEVTLQPITSISSLAMTQHGSPVGTPAYMSPEQAAGQLDKIGPASDIYNLGATLYHALTAHAPIESKNLATILLHVQQGKFTRPRQHDPTITRSLEAICLKAMALKPENRYPTARSLADDLEHWLADEPVTALPDMISDRLRRFARKHQGYVRAGLVGLIVVAFVSNAASFVIDAERRKTADIAVKMTTLAEENASLAKEQQERAIDLQRALARNHFDRGLGKYREGYYEEGITELVQGHSLLPGQDPLAGSYRRVILDRMTQANRLIAAPSWHSGVVSSVAFTPDGTRILSGSDDHMLRIWDAQTGASRGTPMQHRGLNCTAFSPDGTRIVSGSTDKTLRLWNSQTGAPIGDPMRHAAQINCVAFSPDGKRIVSGSQDAVLRIWDGGTGASISSTMQHPGGVSCITFSPDSTRIVSGGVDGTVRVWLVKGGIPLDKSMAHSGKVQCLAFSPDGTRVVSGSEDESLCLWDARTGLRLGEVMKHSGSVDCVAFSPDGNCVVSGSTDKTVRLWNARTSTPQGQPMPHAGRVLCVAFSPDGTRVASGSADKSLQLWDSRTGALIGKPLQHFGDVNCVAFSPEGTRCVTGSADLRLRIWDLQTEALLYEPLIDSGPITSLAFNSTGTRIVSGGEGNTLQLWNTQTGAAIGEPLLHSDKVNCVAFSPDGNRVVSGSDDQTLRLWNASTGAALCEPLKHAGEVSCVAFSPDSNRVISGSADNTLHMWDAKTGAVHGKPMKHAGKVTCVAFSPDGAIVVSGSEDQTLHRWDAKTGAAVGKPMLHFGIVTCLAYSPDGQRIASGSWDKTLRLWDANTGAPIGEPLKHTEWVDCVAFSSDSKRVVSGSDDKTLRVWDSVTGAALSEPMKHGGTVLCVAFSPDNTRVVSGSEDQTVRLWDALTGAAIGEPLKHLGPVTCVAFNRDGTRIASGSRDSTLRLWDGTHSKVEALPRSTFHQVMALWTGSEADPSGSIHSLSAQQSEVLRQKLAEDTSFADLLSQAQTQRRLRLPIIHRLEAYAAEDSENWFAAAFHLKRLKDLDPQNTELATRLADAQKGLATKSSKNK